MLNRRLTIESVLYLIAFCCGFFFRFYHLGETPLSNFEASWALQALPGQQMAASVYSATGGAQPGYRIFTWIVFNLLGSNEFLARLWPALTGSIFILLPVFFRRELGQKAALILAFAFALDPGLIAFSRLAGSSMMAVTFTLFSLALMWAGLPIWAGISFGLGLLSGSTALLGISALGIVGIICWRARQPLPSSRSFTEFKPLLRPALAAALITILAGGTFFLAQPAGVSGLAAVITGYLRNWITSGDTSAGRMLITLVVYHPLPVAIILTQVFYWLIRQSFSEELVKSPPIWPLIWLVTSLVIVLIYPGRQAADIAWIIIPMWLVAAISLGELLPEEKPHLVSIILAALIFILLALFWNTVLSTRQIVSIPALTLPESTSRLVVQLILFVGVIGLGGLSTILVSLGWSPQIGRDGLVLGLTVGIVFYSISVMWGAAQLRQNRPEELFAPAPATGQAGLMLNTIHQLSEQNTAFSDMIDIVSTVDSPSMRWILRNFPRASFVDRLPSGEMPSMVITSVEQDDPSLAAAYRGQDFVWEMSPGWSGTLPPDVVHWFLTRQSPVLEKMIILWVRSDLFPGQEMGTIEDSIP